MKALIIVDIQNDFIPGGALAVPHGDEIIPLVNRLQEKFDLVVATQDWHPSDHCGFASNHEGHEVGEVINIDEISQVLWPDHCIENTKGSEFAPYLDTSKVARIIHKGTDSDIDSYSAFFDNVHLISTGLGDYLKKMNVKEVYLAGLATDYCVRFSALDALGIGFNTTVIEDACRGIELNEGDIARALEEIGRAGGKVIRSDEVFGW